MLKRTKSANQSVLEEAVDNTHTAVTRAGPEQPDEDDYGYVSQESTKLYEKMMEKYSQMPEEPKFNLFKKKVSTNLNSTKDRVKAALEKEKEEAMAPHKRKRKKKDQDGQEGDGKKEEERDNSPERPDSLKEKEVPKPKPKPRPAPPPMSFTELLKIAEKKQFEPIIIEQKPQEEEKLQTKRQKREAEKEREWREKREARRLNEGDDIHKDRDTDKDREKDRGAKLGHVPSSSKSSSKQPTSNTGFSESKILEKQLNKPSSSSSDRDKNHSKPIKHPNQGSSAQRPSGADLLKKPLPVENRSNNPSGAYRKEESKPVKSRDALSNSSRPVISNSNAKSSSLGKVAEQRPAVVSKNVSSVSKSGSSVGPSRDNTDRKGEVGLKKNTPPMTSGKLSGRPKEFPPRDLLPKGKPKEFPPRDLKPKQFPPPDVRGIKRKQPPVVASRGRILDEDSEEEYDSELDDFIDDGPEEGNDYSTYIKEIFGYDKSRYRGLDDDVDDMETSFAQQMKEEVISTKIGIREDLEDMKMEEEEKRRKALRLKKMKR